MILFFDTETTGFPDYRMPVEWDGQPHLVQLAAILADDDGTERACLSTIIRPDGWTIPEGAAKIHGITTEIATEIGMPLGSALKAFVGMRAPAGTLVAHNIKFMRIALARRPQPNVERKSAKLYCTCESAAPVVNLPPTERMIAAGINKPKSPNLGECIQFFFNEKLEGAHDALVDVRACARVYFEIQRRQQAAQP